MLSDGNVSYHDDLAPLMVDIDSVQCHPINYNCGDVGMIMDSIAMSGMYRPIYVQDSTGYIIAGNHTWMACKELGAAAIPVVRLDIDDQTAKRLMVDDNEIAKKARPDGGLLVQILNDLDANSYLPASISQDELMQLRALNEIPLDPDEMSNHRMWPTVCFQIPPHAKNKFYEMTEMAGGDTERFLLVMKLAGWDGKK